MKTKLLFIFLALIFFQSAAFSEWEPFNNGIQGKSPSLNFVKYVDDILYIAGGDNLDCGQGLYSSSDFGDTWKLIGLDYSIITSITKINNQLFVGTKYQGMFYSSNDGKDWEQRNKGLPSEDKSEIYYLVNLGDTLFVSVPDLYYSTDFGVTWLPKSIKIQNELSFHITYLGQAGNILMIGGYYIDVSNPNYISTDGGETWTGTQIESSFDNDEFISYKNKLFFSNYSSFVYASSDYGQNWISTELPTEHIVSIGVKNDTLCAVGSDGNIYISLDNGISFKYILESHIGPVYTITKAAVGKRIIGFREYGTFYNFYDFFWNFKEIETMTIGEIWNINKYSGKLILQTDSIIYTSSTSGDSWEKFTKLPDFWGIPDKTINGIYTIDNSKLVLMHDHNISISSDDGNTWERHLVSDNIYLTNLKFYPEVYLGIAYNYGDYYSLDKGITWQPLPNLPHSSYINDAFLFNDKIYCYSDYAGMFATSNFGESWIELNNTLKDMQGKVHIRSAEVCDNTIFLIKYYYDYMEGTSALGLIKSDDYGGSYKIVYTSFTPLTDYYKNLNSLKTIQDILFAASDPGGLYYTTDKGITWIDKSQGIENIKVLGIINFGEYLYIATTNGVYRDKLAEFGLGVKEQTNNDGILISPNPAADYINVDLGNYTLKGVVEQERIQIFNIFGKCVLSVETQNFVSLQKIDVSSLPAGVYFLKIGTEKPKKFVKM